MGQTWLALAESSANKPGYAAYARQKAAMFTRMARETEERIRAAGYDELLVNDANLVDWVTRRRAVEDEEFEKLVYEVED
uniref:Uncharacterized protein n=1 Tax=Mycena chlorophos TaxID=658473 RepID=A0ABQ0KXB9_MYCCL|nr:predicted protein [Mycena chlorophos]